MDQPFLPAPEKLGGYFRNGGMDQKTNKSDFSKRVLVVDDEEAVLATTAGLL